VEKVKRHVLELRQDERGWVTNPIVPPPAGSALGHVHIASLAPGAVRGNHVHPESGEYVLVWGGRAEMTWDDSELGLVSEETAEGELVVYEIPPGVAHAVKNVGERDVYLIAYYFGASDKEWPATERRPLV